VSNDIQEIFAIKYAHHDRPKAENYIAANDPHDVREPLDYFVWAITGPSGDFVVDTGFDAAMAKKRGRKIEHPIAEGLKAVGIAPDGVKNVILSHLHYDHCGNYDTFPNAKFHVQDTEMAYATGRCMYHAHMRLPFEEEDVVAIVRKVFAGRVTFHDGIDQIAPGITVHKVGGHSKGLQCVRVKTKRGYVVLASDATHLYSHIEGGRVFPITYNIGEVLDGYETIKRLADSAQHIVPGHDPQVLARYPAAKPGMEGWIVRLDADPKAA
jgi:glyoxylase-like metal-dependent hydrolase (beta-lactamase superfamily II)